MTQNFSWKIVLALFAVVIACCNAQNTCIVKTIHLLEQGSPIDMRVGDVVVATNLAFQRSQLSQANVPCGPQPVALFPAGGQTSFRTENFALASGEGVYNYFVFGGEIRAPAATNVFLLSHEAVALPGKRTGQTQLSFWHFSPAARQQQVQMDVSQGGNSTTLITAVANFQQRTNYQTTPNANAFTFSFSDVSLNDLFTSERSTIGVRDGAGTAFVLGATQPSLFLEPDPVGPEVQGDGEDGASESSSSGSITDGTVDGTTESSSSSSSSNDGTLDGTVDGSQSSSSGDGVQTSSGSALRSALLALL